MLDMKNEEIKQLRKEKMEKYLEVNSDQRHSFLKDGGHIREGGLIEGQLIKLKNIFIINSLLSKGWTILF